MTLVVRTPAQDEAESLAALLNAHAHALHGEADVSGATVAEWIASPDVVMRVADVDGEQACYADLMLSIDGRRADLDVRAHPAHAGVEPCVLAELERLARDRGAVTARAFANATEASMQAALAERGYRPIRHSYQMLIGLDRKLPEPAWPTGIAVRTMQASEERAVHAAAEEAFHDHWGFEPKPFDRWLRWTVESGHFEYGLSFLAVEGDEIAGVCLCALHTSGDPRYGWVGTLGVRPRWRRRGIALALLRHAFAAFRARGCDRVGLGVDAESTTGALELYERAGMHVHRRLDAFEKPLS